MPFGLGTLVLIGTSLVFALLLFVVLKLAVLVAQRLLPAQHPSQEFLALLSRHSRSLALWSIRRIQWLLLFALLAAGVVITIVYS
jgi:hypothetical protein